MNGGVERSNRTSREDFFEVEDLALITADLHRQIEGWEYTYNHVRPHQELDYLTPYEYYRHWRKDQKTQMSLMPWSHTVIDIAAQSTIYFRHGLEGRFIAPSGHSTRGKKWRLDTPPIF